MQHVPAVPLLPAPLMVREIFSIIRGLPSAGVTILLVEQNATLALQSADGGYVLEAGRMIMGGAAHELIRDERVRKAYLGLVRPHANHIFGTPCAVLAASVRSVLQCVFEY